MAEMTWGRMIGVVDQIVTRMGKAWWAEHQHDPAILGAMMWLTVATARWGNLTHGQFMELTERMWQTAVLQDARLATAEASHAEDN